MLSLAILPAPGTGNELHAYTTQEAHSTSTGTAVRNSSVVPRLCAFAGSDSIHGRSQPSTEGQPALSAHPSNSSFGNFQVLRPECPEAKKCFRRPKAMTA